MKKHVVYLSYDGLCEGLGQSQILPYILGLSEHEFTFSIISFEKKSSFKSEYNYIKSICEQHEIQWIPLQYTKRPPVLSTLYDCFKLKKTVNNLHKKQAIDLIHCRSYITSLIGLNFSNKNKIPWIFDMRGFWADERVDGKIWKLDTRLFKLIYAYFKKKEIDFLKNSAAVISLTHKAKDIIHHSIVPNSDRSKTVVIPCCVDFDKFNIQLTKEEKEDLKQTYKIPLNTTIIGYLGSIGTWYMLTEMLNWFNTFKKQKDEFAHFLFITSEPKNTIVNSAEKLGISIDDITVISVAPSKVPTFIRLFDFSLFFIRPTFSKMASSPIKQGELMAAGIPIVCNSGVGDTDSILQNYQAGILVDLGNLDPFIEPIDPRIFFNQTNALKGAQEYFGLKNGINSYLKTYRKVLDLNQ